MMIDDDVAACVEVLNDGGLILYPTDTIWGIGCDATNAVAVSKLYALKSRNENKSMLILLADEKELFNYTSQRNLTAFDYIKGIRKPVTVIYQDARNLAQNLINKDGSIGIRIVDEFFCRRLIREFGKPVVSTSSNVSGYPPPAVFADIDIKIRKGVDYIVRYRQDDMTPGVASAVVHLNNDNSFTVIRD